MTGTLTPSVGYFSSYVALRAAFSASAVQAGATAMAGDLGLCYSNGTNWVPVNFPNSPWAYGAVGDGTTDDTVAVQAAINSGYCLLPPNTTFKVTATLTVVSNQTFIGSGGTSIIKCAVPQVGVASVVQISATGANDINMNVGNFQITTAGGGTSPWIGVGMWSGLFSYVHDIWINATVGFCPFYFEASSFCNSFRNLMFTGQVGGSALGGPLTFTGSVGGATSGTLTAPFGGVGANFKLPCVFSTGEIRTVTLAADGVSCTWSPAIGAGTVTVAYMNTVFWLGGGFNANVCDNFTANAASSGFGFYFNTVNNGFNSSASVFNSPVTQNAFVGMYMGDGHIAHTINGLYTENVSKPIVLGNFSETSRAIGHTFNSARPGSNSQTSFPGYAARTALIDFNLAIGITFNSPNLYPGTGIDAGFGANYPGLVFTGGGSPTASAYGYMVINPAGLPKAAQLLFGGAAYSSNPTVTITGGATGGSGASVAATVPGALSSVVITGLNGQFSCTSAALAVGAVLTISGTLGGTGTISGYANPTTYVISKTNGSTTFTIKNPDGSNVETTTGTPTGLTYTITSVTALVLTAGSGGYTGVGAAPIIYTAASECEINNPFPGISIHTPQYGFPLYPFIMQSASAVNGCGITIRGDTAYSNNLLSGSSAKQPTVDTVKTSAADKAHLTYYYTSAGERQTPPNTAGTLTWNPIVFP